jgi:hypothetical protein
MTHSNSSTLNDDFTTGENNNFGEVPKSRWCDGVQWHVLSFLGGNWGSPGLCYSPDWMAHYVQRCNKAGGVVSIDVCLYRDGTIETSHRVCLAEMHSRLEEWKNRKPIPEGNLACFKPARLLSLDGTRELGPSAMHVASDGVDGNPDTGAQAGGEYPWTYEVDLEDPASIQRVVVTFAHDAYATAFDIQCSADHKTWQTIGSATDHDGSRFELKCPPTAARYIRVVAKKPDGEGQRGGQMRVNELEVYQ